MDKPGYTKGPWRVVPYGDGNSLVICTEPDGNWRICFLATPGDSSGAWETIKADARLIAAAPELVEALRNLINAIDTGNLEMNSPEIGGHDDIPLRPWHEEWIYRARAALSKALGEGHSDNG